MTSFLSKCKIAIVLAIIIGLTVGIVKIASFAVSNTYLRLEMYYLISSTLNNHSLVLLITVVAIISVLVILPAIRGLEEYIDRFKIAIILAIIVGFIFGILKSTAFIVSNRYLQYEMYYLIAYSVSSVINSYLLTTLSTVIFVFIALPAIKAFLNFIGVDRKVGNIITCAVVPSLLLFAIGGYKINKTYLPEFFELKSIIGNVIWALVCILLGCVVGWIILKISQIKFNFPKIYGVKSSVAILSLVILFNLIYYLSYSFSIKTDRPNLILISIDTLRADHLSCYGYNRNTTPNIDRFARDAVLFTNTVAQSSWTLPSHMSILTGLYPSSHRVMSGDRKLSDEHLTLAEILQNAGYKTTAFTDGAYLNHKFGYQGFDRFDDTGSMSSEDGIEKIYIKAVSWLRKSHSKPFFLFLHTYQVHAPYNPPPDYDIYSDKNYRGVVDLSEKGVTSGDYFEGIKPQMTLEDYQYIIDKYDGDIYYTDHFLGKLFGELKDLGIYNNSIIILTSDHGENFSDHPTTKVGHHELYDEIIKVPLIIKAPTFPKNQIIGVQVESIDIVPTVLELLGTSMPNRIDGVSLVELVEKGSYDKIFAFSEKSYDYKMIRRNDWKLVHRSQAELELFDLKSDPGEKNNLIAERTEIAKPLYKKLETWIDIQEEKSKLFSADNKIQLDDELTQKLKALGYIN